MMGGKAAGNMYSRNTNKLEFSASVGFIHKEVTTVRLYKDTVCFIVRC
jgi:hypothetical protein